MMVRMFVSGTKTRDEKTEGGPFVYCLTVGRQLRKQKLSFQVKTGDGAHRFTTSLPKPLKIIVNFQKNYNLYSMKRMKIFNTF